MIYPRRMRCCQPCGIKAEVLKCFSNFSASAYLPSPIVVICKLGKAVELKKSDFGGLKSLSSLKLPGLEWLEAVTTESSKYDPVGTLQYQFICLLPFPFQIFRLLGWRKKPKPSCNYSSLEQLLSFPHCYC